MSAAALEPPPAEATRAEPTTRPPIVVAPATLGQHLISVVLWILGVAWMIPVMLFLMLLHFVLPKAWVQRVERIYVRVQLLLLFINWRAVVHPDVDPERQYIFMTTHVNHADHVTMYLGTKHHKQGLELKEHFRYPFYGWFMKARGTIGVERSRGSGQSQAVLDEFRRELDAGRSILAYPEGTRTTTGRVGRLRKGTFFIAQAIGAPIVPVAVTGMYEVMHKGSLVLRPGHTVTVTYGAPIETAHLTEADIPALVERVYDELTEVVDAHWAAKGLADGGTIT